MGTRASAFRRTFRRGLDLAGGPLTCLAFTVFASLMGETLLAVPAALMTALTAWEELNIWRERHKR